MIEELVITNLKRISVPGGDILHGMKKTDNGYSDFGEIYFSYILKLNLLMSEFVLLEPAM